MTADTAVTSALRALSAALAELGQPSMVIGGIAVIARGVPRTTLDIDATVWSDGLDLDRALAVFSAHGIAPRIDDARAFAMERQVLLLRHEASGMPIDVALAWLPFEQEALARATLVDFGGFHAAVARAEDLIVYKSIAWRERDRTDIERLLALHRNDIDLSRVRTLLAQFAAALDAPERVSEFEAVVDRAFRAHLR
jgi:hypothetical protein